MKHLAVLSILCLFVLGCGGETSEDVARMRRELADLKRQLAEKKSRNPKPVISRENYFLRRSVDDKVRVIVKGVVKNAGSGDSKNVVITTDCGGCSTVPGRGVWVAFKPGEGAFINYLGARDKETFVYTVATMTSPKFVDLLPGVVSTGVSLPKWLNTRVLSWEHPAE